MAHCRIFIMYTDIFLSIQDFTIEFEDVKVTKLKQKQIDFGLIGLDASSVRLLDSLSIPNAK